MVIKLLLIPLLVLFSWTSNAALGEESPETEDTNVVLLQALTPLGETQIDLVKGFIETTLSISLNLNASKASSGAFRYTSSRDITTGEQQLITNTLPTIYEVGVSFPASNFEPRPDDGGGFSTSNFKPKKKKIKKR